MYSKPRIAFKFIFFIAKNGVYYGRNDSTPTDLVNYERENMF